MITFDPRGKIQHHKAVVFKYCEAIKNTYFETSKSTEGCVRAAKIIYNFQYADDTSLIAKTAYSTNHYDEFQEEMDSVTVNF